MEDLNWYEVWLEDTLIPPCTLLLMCQRDESLAIFDQVEQKIVLKTSDYGEARNWLLEDEYRQVIGRMKIE
ncbi:hypothetical protein ACN9MU_06625 [Pseudoduganella sp. R-32]|uniref:hypothetical protein n=1 Tax=Pseudoduganella sp. R-32 TaxID=3404061 RepID=UPI003CF97A91